ncbi:MAG TPA: hypothetical protein PLK03_04985 [Termitinemataceae bacterium]|nr:hypothetical protein [Termitinemataceae bacterium]
MSLLRSPDPVQEATNRVKFSFRLTINSFFRNLMRAFRRMLRLP